MEDNLAHYTLTGKNPEIKGKPEKINTKKLVGNKGFAFVATKKN